MQCQMEGWWKGILAFGLGLSLAGPLYAEEPSPPEPTAAPTPSQDEPQIEEPWIEALPVPADPELEEQIQEVQEALSAIHRQMVRRKEALRKTSDPAAKTTLYDELERLRKEREDLEALLHDLVEEAQVSERTAIDEALARARWLEQRQEYWDQKEELIRDRQQ